MNILFIWIGRKSPLYEWRTMCIRRALEIYPNANFQVITMLKSFFNMAIIDPYDVGIDLDETMVYSDYVRLDWLSRHPNTLYLDTDTFCMKPMPLTRGMGSAGFEAIWSGHDQDKIREVFYSRGEKKLLYPLAQKFKGHNLADYFEHKPLWSKKYR